MKLSLWALAASLACVACSLGLAAPPPAIELGKTFGLRPGQHAQSGDAALTVGFDGVLGDSRCPKGVQCVWAGEASVRVWMQAGNGPKVFAELRTSANAASVAKLAGHELQLTRLDPYPVASTRAEPASYMATLMLSRAAPAAPER